MGSEVAQHAAHDQQRAPGVLDRLCLRSSGLVARRELTICAPPARIMRALSELTFGDLTDDGLSTVLLRLVRWIGRSEATAQEPLLTWLLGVGFSVIGSDPLQEVVIGHPCTLHRVLGGSPENSSGHTEWRSPRVRLAIGVRLSRSSTEATTLVSASILLPSRHRVIIARLQPLWRLLRRSKIEPFLDAWLRAAKASAEHAVQGRRPSLEVT